jgi:hypothetical protein
MRNHRNPKTITRRILRFAVHAAKLIFLIRSVSYPNTGVFNLAQLPSSHSLSTDTSTRYAALHHLDMELVAVSTTLQYAKGERWRQNNNTHCIASSSVKTLIDHSKQGHIILLLLRNSSLTTGGMNRTDWEVCVNIANLCGRYIFPIYSCCGLFYNVVRV